MQETYCVQQPSIMPMSAAQHNLLFEAAHSYDLVALQRWSHMYARD